MKKLIGWLITACLLSACPSPDEGPELGEFAAITKKDTDEPFDLTVPSSKSPAPFSFTSSDTAVATIDGARVTIVGAGETTITASQPRSGSFGPTQKSTKLTVTPSACIAPAAVSGGRCVAPASSAATVSSGGLSWMGTTSSDNWTNARDFCKRTVINNQTGWRLPTIAELTALHASGQVAGKGWVLGQTWSSDLGSTLQVASHMSFNLAAGGPLERADTALSYVTCVR